MPDLSFRVVFVCPSSAYARHPEPMPIRAYMPVIPVLRLGKYRDPPPHAATFLRSQFAAGDPGMRRDDSLKNTQQKRRPVGHLLSDAYSNVEGLLGDYIQIIKYEFRALQLTLDIKRSGRYVVPGLRLVLVWISLIGIATPWSIYLNQVMMTKESSQKGSTLSFRQQG